MTNATDLTRDDGNGPLVAYVGPFAFPDGGAAARRILGNALALREAGYKVVIGSGQLPSGDGSIAGQDTPMPFEVASLGERTSEGYPTLVKHVMYLTMGGKTLRWLQQLERRPSAVILYSGYSAYLSRLLPWCERQGIPLVFDAVEWYQPSNMPGGPLGPYRWNIELAIRYYCVRTHNIIAISRYLEEYYRRRRCRTLRVPPTLDVRALEPRIETRERETVTIGYTGTPGRKDLLDSVVEAVLRADPSGHKVRLRVAGVDESGLLASEPLRRRGLSSLPKCVEGLGRVPHSEALALVREADFTALLRRPLRYAQAGFPTKVVESMSLGTPVICNLTSDLGEHIRDGEEGIICRDFTPEAFAEALERVLTVSPEQYRAMRHAARAEAERSFDYRNYVARLRQFMLDIGA